METARIEEGKQILADHLSRTEEAARLFLASLKGFRRDLALSLQSCGSYIEAHFESLPNTLAIASMKDGSGFALLEKTLRECEGVLDGGIRLSQPKEKDAEMLDKETSMMHENLVSVAEMAHQLNQVLMDASLAFDMFNSENLSKKMQSADIIFGRDSLNVAMATARALGERAIRLDIDLVASKHRIEFPEHKTGQ